jgi:hypothetical protein
VDRPFFVDLLELERLRVDRLLEDRVFCAIFLAFPLGFLAGCAVRADGASRLPDEVGFELWSRLSVRTGGPG